MSILATAGRGARRFWEFLWHDDSALSWITNIAVAFLLVRFIIYPLLGLMLGTGFPVVAVMSGSMEHTGPLDTWWGAHCLETRQFPDGSMLVRELNQTVADSYAQYGIKKEDISRYPFKNGFNTGDIIILTGAMSLKRGDVIVFGIDQPVPIIHRVVNISADSKFFKTKGDSTSNCDSHPFEQKVASEAVVGKALLRVPYLGWIKIAAVGLITTVMDLFR